MRVHIVPCGDKYARKHHAKTIEKLVPREEIILFENDKKLTSTLKDDAYACWGVTNAKNNSNYKRQILFLTYTPKSEGSFYEIYHSDKFKVVPPDICKVKGKTYRSNNTNIKSEY